MLRFLLYTALALTFSALAATATDRYADGCLNNLEPLCILCHSNNRSNSTIRSEHWNSGTFVIKGKTQRVPA